MCLFTPLSCNALDIRDKAKVVLTHWNTKGSLKDDTSESKLLMTSQICSLAYFGRAREASQSRAISSAYNTESFDTIAAVSPTEQSTVLAGADKGPVPKEQEEKSEAPIEAAEEYKSRD
jgi:hypothetical protein